MSKIFNVCLICFLFFIDTWSMDQSNISRHSVFIASNIVDIKNNELFINRLENIFNSRKDPFTFIINGDLVNSKFEKRFKKDSLRILSLINSISKYPNGKTIIIPGERDWDNSGKSGLKNVKKLEKLVKTFKRKNVKWAIKNGCPGPKDFKLQENILLISINTQWWNHPHNVPGPIDGDCKTATTDDFKEELEDLINENPDKNIIVAGHYPIFSNGEFGGHQPFLKHIFPLTDWIDYLYVPLPIIGSFYSSFRENIGTSDDIINENYEETRELIENIIAQYQSIIYISGHDKTQQIYQSGGNYHINSGAPESSEFASFNEGSILDKNAPGIIEVVYHPDGKVSSVFHEFENKSPNITEHELTLFHSACDDNAEDYLVNHQFDPCSKIQLPSKKMSKEYPEIGFVIAGPEYEAGALKRFFMGDHYRDTWTKKIQVPYLNLDTAKGGLTAIKKGGGRQTLSLKLQGGNGIRYVFRSVNKDPVKALSYDLRNTGIARIVKDQTTTQHPYGAMAADILLNELGIIHAHPKLYLMPDDPKLGKFREDFGGMLGMLEEHPKDPKKDKIGFLGSADIVRSNKLFRKIYNDHNNRINTHEFAVARVFDILVGDWGKHEDNWKWIGFKEGKKTIYRPMPRDRDHVFSRWDGLLPWIFDREWAKESGEDFNFKISGLRSLMNQARHLDRFVASDLTKKDWIMAAEFVQSKITVEIIDKAVKNMPGETYELSGRIIADKLKARVKDLDKYVLEYYDMICPEVDIVGSNKKEYFDVKRNGDGSVSVKVYDAINMDKGSDLIYSRIFIPEETGDIRLYGLGGRDIFNITGVSENSIKLRIFGGTGKDSINDASVTDASTLVYDKGNKTKIKKGESTQIIKPYHKSFYKYDRTSFAYDTYFPLPYISYNKDDGFIFKPGIKFTLHNFDKLDYSARHRIQAEVSSSKSLGIKYEGRFHDVYKAWDVSLGGHYYEPMPYTYFYGFGNETVKDNKRYDQNYYRTRYASREIRIGIVKDFWTKSSFRLESKYANNEQQESAESTIFGENSFVGTEKINFIEGTVSLDLDFRNRRTLPSSGTKFYAEYNNGFVTNLDYSNYGKLLLIGEGYLSFSQFLPLTFAVKLGGGKSFGKIPFYNQFNLGQNNFLKGYTNNRFTGSSIAFMQTGLRLNLFGFNGTLVPMQVGMIGYFNSGRVFQSGESSQKWHNGFGGGFYIIPLREEFTVFTAVSFSEEETLLLEFGIGSTL